MWQSLLGPDQPAQQFLCRSGQVVLGTHLDPGLVEHGHGLGELQSGGQRLRSSSDWSSLVTSLVRDGGVDADLHHHGVLPEGRLKEAEWLVRILGRN